SRTVGRAQNSGGSLGARSAEEAVQRPQSAPRLSLANRVSHMLQRRFDVLTSLFTPWDRL
ncbi:hypothetical protein K7G98_43175, partial [Saccharothrix sp. MB29]|nr:hypothetical protein [Saccharothrix sp. MB29]